MRLAVLVSMLVKHIQIQTDNVHSSLGSAHCSCEKSIDLHLLKSAFIPFYETLVRPHQEYGMPSCSASMFSKEMAYWHLSHSLRWDTAVAGFSFPVAVTASGWPAFMIFTWILDEDPHLFFSPFDSIRPYRYPYKTLQGPSWRPGSTFSVKVVNCWKKLRASVATAPSVNIFTKLT